MELKRMSFLDRSAFTVRIVVSRRDQNPASLSAANGQTTSGTVAVLVSICRREKQSTNHRQVPGASLLQNISNYNCYWLDGIEYQDRNSPTPSLVK